jgi:hypothetical protein
MELKLGLKIAIEFFLAKKKIHFRKKGKQEQQHEVTFTNFHFGLPRQHSLVTSNFLSSHGVHGTVSVA